jgi:hypothetical protein
MASSITVLTGVDPGSGNFIVQQSSSSLTMELTIAQVIQIRAAIDEYLATKLGQIYPPRIAKTSLLRQLDPADGGQINGG